MDGVLADFEKGFITQYRHLFSAHTPVPVEQRKNFYVINDYPDALQKDIESVYHTPGFFKALPVISGGKEALEHMRAIGHEVFICTSPLPRYDDCVLEKYDWVARNLGHEWTKRMIVTRDKTLVHGDFLIDDKPEPIGVRTPVWEHIIYDAPYNRTITHKRRITWDSWQTEVSELTVPAFIPSSVATTTQYGEN